jgi:hypothetical protein
MANSALSYVRLSLAVGTAEGTHGCPASSNASPLIDADFCTFGRVLGRVNDFDQLPDGRSKALPFHVNQVPKNLSSNTLMRIPIDDVQCLGRFQLRKGAVHHFLQAWASPNHPRLLAGRLPLLPHISRAAVSALSRSSAIELGGSA